MFAGFSSLRKHRIGSMKFKAHRGSASNHKQKGNEKNKLDTNSKSSTLFAKFVKKKDLHSSQLSGAFIKKSKGISFKLNSNETSAQEPAFELQNETDSTRQRKNQKKLKKLKFFPGVESGLQSMSENNMLIGCMQETEEPQQLKKLKKKSKEIRTAKSNTCNDDLGEEEENNSSSSKVNPAALSKALRYEERTASDHSKKKKKKCSYTESSDLQLCDTDELLSSSGRPKKCAADLLVPKKKKHKKFLQQSAIFDGNDSISGTKNEVSELGAFSRVKSEGGKKRKREQLLSQNSDLISEGIEDQSKNFKLDYGGGENSEQKKKRRKRLKNCFEDVMQDSTKSDTSFTMLKNASTAGDDDMSESGKLLLETEPSKIDSSDFIQIPKKELRGFQGREDTPERRGRTVFVGNLPLSMSRKLLHVLFRNSGNIESVRLRSVVPAKSSISKKVALIKKEFHNESNSVNGYVVFKRQEDARKALVLNKTVIQGHHIRVDLFNSNSNVIYDNKRSVFIGNLPFNTTDESLWEVFGECGTIEAVRVVRDPSTGAGKGFGFVLFEERESVKNALALNETEFNGRRIRVKAVEKESKMKGKASEGNQGINFEMKKKNVSTSGWRSAGQKKTKKKLMKKKRDMQKKKRIASILTH